MTRHRIIVLIQMAVAVIACEVSAQNPKGYLQNYTSPSPAVQGSLTSRHSHHPSWGNGNAGWNGPGINAYGPGWAGNGFGPSGPMWGCGPGMMEGGPWNATYSGPDYQAPATFNNGIAHVVGVGYDAQGVWETVPLIVQYQWDGAQYDLTVLDAWNPWTRAWDGRLDISAYQTQYSLRGVTYDWYVNLSTGTYYFNL